MGRMKESYQQQIERLVDEDVANGVIPLDEGERLKYFATYEELDNYLNSDTIQDERDSRNDKQHLT